MKVHNQLPKTSAHSANKTKTSRLNGEKKNLAKLLKDVLRPADSAQSAKLLEISKNPILRKDSCWETFLKKKFRGLQLTVSP